MIGWESTTELSWPTTSAAGRGWAFHIASIDTLHRRTEIPPADLLFLDEAHFTVSAIWKSVLDRYPGVPAIGMTATPCRADGSGLGVIYDTLILGPTVADLTARGYLVPARVFAPPGQPDLTNVRMQAGEYNQRQLATVCNKTRLVGDIVDHWRRLARDRKTVAFAVDVTHSYSIRDQFRAAGFEWEHVDAKTPDDERERIWAALDNGSLNGVSSVGVISYGWDHPIVSAVILARPTASLSLHLQQCGRGLRPAQGKADLLALDHAGNHGRHGFVDDPHEWTLAGDPVKPTETTAPAVRLCKRCYRTFQSGLKCPECGWTWIPTAREIEEINGTLEEIRRDEKARAITAWRARQTEEERARKFDEYRAESAARGYKPGWAYTRFRAVFGCEPPRTDRSQVEQAAIEAFL